MNQTPMEVILDGQVTILKQENEALVFALFELLEETRHLDITHPEIFSDLNYKARVAIGYERLGKMRASARLEGVKNGNNIR